MVIDQSLSSKSDLLDPGLNDGGLLTAEEVAAWLRVTPAWVYAETRGGRIPHLRLGRYVRYRREALELWMEQIESVPVSRRRSHYVAGR
jgi:excisionase family DNA binding protein